MAATAHAIVEDEVRELVRRRGIDPIAEPEAVARLVDEVLNDYHDRSITSSLPPMGDATLAGRAVLDAVAGFGPLQPLLDDSGIEEIWINEPGRVFVARRGRSELTTVILTADQVAELVERMLRPTGRRIDLSTPFVDAMLPDGSRLHVVIPTITRRHMAVNIRKFAVGLRSLDELVRVGSVTGQAARFLDASVAAGLNILVAGGTQAGKTTMLNALCGAVPARERIVTVEEVFELNLGLPDVVAMQTRQANLEGTGEIPLRRLVKEALRMRPSRLIVGEVRQEECLDLLIALNSGLPGMCTLHANSAREALVKMCTLPLLAGENVSAAFVVPTVAASVDLVVHLGLEASGQRRVREIVGVTGRVEGDVIETAEIFGTRRGRLERADGYPPHAERYAAAGIDLVRALGQGIDPAATTPATPATAPAASTAGR
ncbi:pilus assembly protein CpaF [Jatrophihabitans endophyticus]|uniref:Pilus assembly protein CpaF n=1 Tax=Jatrophihabitans endophyticus TaxID=1206085 RepID=A0A1M5RSA5_9ACTN|nr:ATPase, T2SS/T4P/T4SS family [Jatrophihabitans endophyticus]SHH29126.1 pilus assembly protein CpaF [Jatrophihabitans endophyticus]